jgi:hypothetical protein
MSRTLKDRPEWVKANDVNAVRYQYHTHWLLGQPRYRYLTEEEWEHPELYVDGPINRYSTVIDGYRSDECTIHDPRTPKHHAEPSRTCEWRTGYSWRQSAISWFRHSGSKNRNRMYHHSYRRQENRELLKMAREYNQGNDLWGDEFEDVYTRRVTHCDYYDLD